ncbi:hypothetical protein CBM2623_B30115 [Cupriavidus taiwanensis]|nr:hypothetical protein CBM2608_B30119 [Cupriavidus taiwanensis]SPA34468.1 hypothetical protein CBM2623_B30115 [Cupriavidus taiwanensis]
MHFSIAREHRAIHCGNDLPDKVPCILTCLDNDASPLYSDWN